MQKLQLSIPEPCHENWQQMTATDQGRFCNACAKEVIDFSMMTDKEVLNYFTTRTHEKVCGRALPSQLERSITQPKDPKKRLFWYWNYIVMFCMFFKGNNAVAQSGTKHATELQFTPKRSVAKMGEVAVNPSRIIKGKITDIHGNPVSFASIKIKGTYTGVSADANGVYSLKINSNSILIFSGASFKDIEILVGGQSVINTVMKKDPNYDLKEVVVTIAGGIRRRIIGDESKIVNENPVVIFKVKEDNSDLVVENAIITIIRNNSIKTDTAINEKKGIYGFNKINEGSNYLIKVEAAGYQPHEFAIDPSDIRDGKKEWEVFLKKQNSAFGNRIAPLTQDITGDFQVHRVGQTRIAPVSTDSLYVIDGVITTKANADKLNEADISDIVRLNRSDAAAIFGIEGSNGAVVITTRKSKEIKMKEVVVNSGTMMGGIRSFTRTETTIIERCEILVDTVKTFVANFTGSTKVYPNPVQRGNEISISLKLKQTGLHQIQITDAAGRIVLQKQINATSMDATEKIMTDNRWSSGIYYISITGSKNKLINKSSFVLQ